MSRYIFILILVLAIPLAAFGKRGKWAFRIKTASGGIVSNVVIEGTDVDDAKYKLSKRYPNSRILSTKSLD